MFDESRQYIVVSATALANSGALTILKQFLLYASRDENYYIIFVPTGLNLPMSNNIIYIECFPKSWIKRIHWDWWGFKQFLNDNNINVKQVVSLQNSSVNVKKKQIVYLHQAIPFSSYDEFLTDLSLTNLKLFLYKKLYSYFIFKFITYETKVVVQTEWMKSAVIKRCSRLSSDNVVVVRPDIKDIYTTKNTTVENNTIIYPATPLSYKNHLILLDAIVHLKSQYMFHELKLQVTFNKGDYKRFDDIVAKCGLDKNIDYVGIVSYAELLKFYQRATMVVYPSCIESFGLPLIEAASLGKKIVCSDLPYANEVLNGYEGVTFVKYNDKYEWCAEINKVLTQAVNLKFKPFVNNERSSWPLFFDLLKY